MRDLQVERDLPRFGEDGIEGEHASVLAELQAEADRRNVRLADPMEVRIVSYRSQGEDTWTPVTDDQPGIQDSADLVRVRWTCRVVEDTHPAAAGQGR